MKRGALSYEAIIGKLAEAHGIEPEYIDNWGRVQSTTMETKKKILDSLGVTVDTPAQAEEAWLARLEQGSSHLAEPAIVATLSDLPKELAFQLPLEAQGAAPDGLKVFLAVTDEQGVKNTFSCTQKDVSYSGAIQPGNTTFHRFGIPFPQLQAIGHYRFHLSVSMGDEHKSQDIFVAVCPDKAYMPPALQGDGRTAGIAVSLYGLRSDRNWGIGDFGDLKDLADWVVDELRGGIIALNPLHAISNRRPFNTSPYLPLSRFYRNFIYLHIPAIQDYQDSSEAQALVEAPETQKLLSELRSSKTVEYEKVAVLKEKVLMQIFHIFLKNHWNKSGIRSTRRSELEDYIEKEGDLLDKFATFCALDSAMRSSNQEMWTWLQWPPEYHKPDAEAVQEFRQEHRMEILFYKYVQWQLEKQLCQVQEHAKRRGMCIGLYHDLALAIDRFSADFWAYQDFFIPQARVGAPPDAFSQNGQDWGFPPPNIERLRQTGYELFVREIRKNCAFGGALRIDHAMRFFHLYCIPEGELPTKGAYISQPFEDLLKILALESVRNRVVIIGEDLGTVPAYIREALSEANIFSYRLLYFERDDRQDFIRPQDYPELALVTVTTHDLPTLAGYWTHRDIEIRKEAGMFDSHQAMIEAAAEREADKKKLLKIMHDLGLLPAGCAKDPNAYPELTAEIHNAVVGFLAMTQAKLFVLSQEDLFKTLEQQNLPGTTGEYPNWSLKMKYSLEQLRAGPDARAFCNMFRTWIEKSGRS
ncbi:MAG: 4-alpha-glucanotransferase [Desulfobacterales bacterium]|nr:4-alpha-glucanotransferase [Desulfobacterales bacterium]